MEFNTGPVMSRKLFEKVMLFGEDLFKLLSEKENAVFTFYESTQAMEIDGVGCIVKVYNKNE